MRADPCADMALLVQAELDGELDAAGSASLAAHVAGCPDCAALQAEFSGLSSRLRGGVTRYEASAELRRAVMPVRRRRVPWSHGVSFGGGMALAAGLAALMLLPGRGDMAGELVAAHIRALQPGHLVDVQSSDQHTVKPWFDGRLDYAPPVADFAAKGFPLIGGRLDYLAGRPVAALVYGRDKHLIDLFVWPGDRAGADGVVQGYNVESWSVGGMNFRAVSDLNMRELREFAVLVQGR